MKRIWHWLLTTFNHHNILPTSDNNISRSCRNRIYYSMITWNCQKVNASCTQTSQQKLIPTHVLTSFTYIICVLGQIWLHINHFRDQEKTGSKKSKKSALQPIQLNLVQKIEIKLLRCLRQLIWKRPNSLFFKENQLRGDKKPGKKTKKNWIRNHWTLHLALLVKTLCLYFFCICIVFFNSLPYLSVCECELLIDYK